VILVITIGVISAGTECELKKYYKDLPFQMSNIEIPVFPDYEVNIVEFGAIGNGKIMNTKAINDAIKKCSQKGGGTVLIPAGMWLTGPITLRSNVKLHLEEQAFLQFSSNYEDYPLINSNWEGQDQVRAISPISGIDLSNIAITGHGVIDGAGEAWRPVKKFKMTDHQWHGLINSGGAVDEDRKIWWPSKEALNGARTIRELAAKENVAIEEYAAAREYLRPVMINLVNCKGVLLDGPTFQNSPAWNIHPLMCENMIIRNIVVRNPWYSQNGDGLDLESCRNVLVYNSNFDVGDDAICIKSGKNEYGRERGKPTENVIIDGCTVYHGHGGFTVGSEMSGGVRNISVTNCTFIGTDVGLRFKSTRGRGGIVENIFISDIYMKNIPTEAIRFNLFYDYSAPIREDGQEEQSPFLDRPSALVTEETPQFKDIEVKNIFCRGAETAVKIIGLPEMTVKNIKFDNMVISANKGFIFVDTEDIVLKNINATINKGSIISCFNSKNMFLENFSKTNDIETFIMIDGERSKNIKIQQGEMTLNKEQINLGKTVSSDVLIIQ
jgi:polygalacturonase